MQPVVQMTTTTCLQCQVEGCCSGLESCWTDTGRLLGRAGSMRIVCVLPLLHSHLFVRFAFGLLTQAGVFGERFLLRQVAHQANALQCLKCGHADALAACFAKMRRQERLLMLLVLSLCSTAVLRLVVPLL